MDNYDLPQQVLYDILLKLPVKFLYFRGQWVSESWSHLINSGNFKADHFRRISMMNAAGQIMVEHTPLHDDGEGYDPNDFCFASLLDQHFNISTHLSCPSHEFGNGDSPVIAGTCNGIVCLRGTGNQCLLLLWNPAIEEYKIVPEPPNAGPEPPTNAIIRWPNPRVCFGFDIIHNDYKVIKFSTYRYPDRQIDSFPAQMNVYTLGNNIWRNIAGPGGASRGEIVSNLYLCGAYHWLIGCANNSIYILSFDLGREDFHEIPFPHSCIGYDKTLLSLEGTLAIILYRDVGSETAYYIWVRKEDDTTQEESWIQRYAFVLTEDLKPLLFWKSGIFFENWGSLDNELVFADLSTRKSTSLLSLSREFEDCLGLYIYRESLFSFDAA